MDRLATAARPMPTMSPSRAPRQHPTPPTGARLVSPTHEASLLVRFFGSGRTELPMIMPACASRWFRHGDVWGSHFVATGEGRECGRGWSSRTRSSRRSRSAGSSAAMKLTEDDGGQRSRVPRAPYDHVGTRSPRTAQTPPREAPAPLAVIVAWRIAFVGAVSKAVRFATQSTD